MKRLVTALVALILALPAPLLAQEVDPLPPIPPCPWWDCGGSAEVVVEQYRVDVDIEGAVATTRVTQVLRNDGHGLAEGRFLLPIPDEAAVTGLVLWIDGEPVSGEILDGDTARRTYEQIVRDTRDPALLEFADDGLLSLSVFPIPEGAERTVEVEYRQILTSDAGLVHYRQPMGREHSGVEVESVVARVSIDDPHGLKAIHSPTHAVSLDRIDETSAVVGYEGSGRPDGDFVLYWSNDAAPISVDVISHRDGDEGWFVLLASPGLARDDVVTPKDVVLVLDVSGSMEGEKIAQARVAARHVLDDLNPEDRFEVLAFSTGTDAFGDGLRPASDADAAESWVGRLAAGGATDIHLALTEAFELAEPGRPLYVIFLTDGLPTEGLVDTSDILSSLEQSETTSVFAFGVGYDVDTVLLDSIARDHHGTTEYVVPGEEIDTAIAALSAKVASPVLTAVQLTIDGVDAFDLHPAPLPDVFSGGQLVLTGRYEGSGPATATLTGRLRGEPVEITYDDIVFSAAGGDESAAALWATRKIGALLRQIRIDGPSEETIEQIVRISIRHGIVTPYTSYLVTEPAPFGEEAVEDITRQATATTTTYAASGEAAVNAADAASTMSSADVAPDGADDRAGIVATAGGRTLRLTDGVWIDTTFDPTMETRRVLFGSEDYFALATSGPGVSDVLATGTRVVVVVDGVAYEIVTEGPADELPASVGAGADDPASTTPTTEPEILVMESIEHADDEAADALVAVFAAMAAVGVMALVALRRS